MQLDQLEGSSFKLASSQLIHALLIITSMINIMFNNKMSQLIAKHPSESADSVTSLTVIVLSAESDCFHSRRLKSPHLGLSCFI